MSRLWVIAYDVTDDKRRSRIAKFLLNHTERVQKSVYEGWLSTSKVREIAFGVNALIDAEEDSVRMYPIGGDGMKRRQTQGNVNLIRPTPDFWHC